MTFEDELMQALEQARQDVLARVRHCPLCHRQFLKVGKKKYCSHVCSNRAAWRAFVSRGQRRRSRSLMDVLANGTDEVAFLADVPHEQQTHAWDVEV